MNNLVTLIPCSGFGTRMKVPSNRSKELLIDPENNEPIINWCLKHVPNPLLIIRKEKEDLIDFAKHSDWNYIIIEETKEWPETILKAGYRWKENNLLVLPDTRFSDSMYTIESVIDGLRDKPLSFGIHKVNDISKWGKVDFDNTIEKPEIPARYRLNITTGKNELLFDNEEGFAWGLIGFNRNVGHGLFTAYLNKTRYDYYPEGVKFTKMHWFKDVTR